MVPGATRLPFVGGGGGDVPEQALARPDVAVDPDRLAAYDRVCGFDLSDTLPPTYPHMLAFPMHLALMTDGRFPLPAIGLVHIANAITVHRPVGRSASACPCACGRRRSSPTRAAASSPSAPRRGWTASSSGRSPRPTSAGAAAAGRPGRSSRPSPRPARACRPRRRGGCAGDLGRRYGAVSGDLNPIHVHPLSARLFGFPSAIAHGMWTKARCLAALVPELPGAYTATVAFASADPVARDRRSSPRPRAHRRERSRSACATPTAAPSHLDGVVSPATLRAPRSRRQA